MVVAAYGAAAEVLLPEVRYRLLLPIGCCRMALGPLPTVCFRGAQCVTFVATPLKAAVHSRLQTSCCCAAIIGICRPAIRPRDGLP